MNEKEYTRLIELETKAKNDFINNSDWNAVIEMLEQNEQKEYWELWQKKLKEVKQ